MAKIRHAFVLCLMLSTIPVCVQAQPPASAQHDASANAPSVAASMIREGYLAVRLEMALGVGTTEDEIQAESLLGGVGIIPRNGWIADYPATPDIIGELQLAIGMAADSRKIPLSRDEALARMKDVTGAIGLHVTPYTRPSNYLVAPSMPESYPNPIMVNNYYYDTGAPVVTYYNPPPDFYYLYAWIPYPFWESGFWFPGFFILNDFHRIVIIDHQLFHVTNHFNDIRAHRVFRIDPGARFRGKTFAGIGAPRSRNFISTGVVGSERRIFNEPHGAPNGRIVGLPRGTVRGTEPSAGAKERGGMRGGGGNFRGGGHR